MQGYKRYQMTGNVPEGLCRERSIHARLLHRSGCRLKTKTTLIMTDSGLTTVFGETDKKITVPRNRKNFIIYYAFNLHCLLLVTYRERHVAIV